MYGGGPSYLDIAQFHPKVNLSVPLCPIHMGREELHGHGVNSAVFATQTNVRRFKLKTGKYHLTGPPTEYQQDLPATDG